MSSHHVRKEASLGLSPGAQVWVTVTMATGESLPGESGCLRLGLTTIDVVSQCPVSAASSWPHDGSQQHYKTQTMTRSICHSGHSYHLSRQLGDGDCVSL